MEILSFNEAVKTKKIKNYAQLHQDLKASTIIKAGLPKGVNVDKATGQLIEDMLKAGLIDEFYNETEVAKKCLNLD